MAGRSLARLEALVALALLSCAGCAELEEFWSDLNGVTVQVINDTALDVAPNIRFDDDDGGFDAFLAGVFGVGDDLATGLLEPGEVVEFTFDCDALGLIFSDDAEQFLVGVSVAEADESDVLRRGEHFQCGDVVRFRFIGTFDNFGVLISVNGAVVD